MSLSPQQLDQFHSDGYLVLNARVAPHRCEAMLGVTLDHLQRAVPPIDFEAEVGSPGAPASRHAPGGHTARRLRAAHGRAACFCEWAGEPTLVGELAQLLGEDVILSLAHHNCVMTKHPRYGTATGWHRDIRYWSYGRNALISSWLALGEETVENGALCFIPGSHRLHIDASQLDDLDFLRPEVAANQALFERGVTPMLQRGDVVLFHSGLFHSAGRNNTDRMKASVVFAYRGKSNPPVPGTRSAAAGEVELGRG
jgi:phytanoyl-CoA hydroxylase